MVSSGTAEVSFCECQAHIWGVKVVRGRGKIWLTVVFDEGVSVWKEVVVVGS